MKRVLFLLMGAVYMLILSLSFNDCSKNISPTQIVSTDHPSDTTYIGSWNWVISIGGITGFETMTPVSTGYTKKIILNPDSTFESYRNDTLIATTQYTIKREKMSFAPDSVDVIHYGNTDRSSFMIDQMISLSGPDTLSLIDLCYDCFSHAYVRIK